MKRVIAAVALLLAACSPNVTTAPTPGPPTELAFLSGPTGTDGPHVLVQVHTGAVLASFPDGILDVGLSSGGDVAEAYFVVIKPGGGTEIDAVIPSRSFAREKLLEDPRATQLAVLVDAPRLTSFVGRPSVLVVSYSNGDLVGYQHGARLWSESLTGPARYLSPADPPLVLTDGGWQPLAPETGKLGQVETKCPVSSRQCQGDFGAGKLPATNQARVFKLGGGAALVTYDDGQVWRASATDARRLGSTAAPSALSAIAPNLAAVYVPTPDGIQRFDLASGTTHPFANLAAIDSIALSRDGNYLYALARGRFVTFATGSGARLGSFPTDQSSIDLIAGG